MKRIAVNSGDLLSIGYNADLQLLEVEFLDGSIYQFVRVSTEVYASLMRAEVIHSYFYAEIADIYANQRVFP